MSDDKFYIKSTPPPNDGARIQEDSKKPTGAVTSSKNFKRILDKDDEDRGNAGRVYDKEEEEEGPSASTLAGAARTKGSMQSKQTKSTASNEDVFSLFGTQKGKGPQKQASLQAGAELSEDPTIQEDEAEVNPQQNVTANTNAESGTQVRAPKPKQAQQQSLLETTFTQSAAIASQDKPKSLSSLKEPKSAVKERPASGQEDSSRVARNGEERENVEWDNEDAPSQFGYDDLSDAGRDNEIGSEVALANPNALQSKKDIPAFDLSRNTVQEKAAPEPTVAVRPEGLSDVQRANLRADAEARIAASKDITAQESVVRETPVKKDNFANPFVQEQVDLSSVNPQALVTPVAAVDLSANITTAAAAKPIPATATMYVLLEALAKEISVMRTQDKTETTVILQRPPLFANAQVMITGFDSAKGELNISFGNLTQNAQHVIEQQQQNLLLALETKGYHVHIFTVTTIELQNPIAAQQSGQESQQQRQRGQQQGKNEQEGREEEKEA